MQVLYVALRFYSFLLPSNSNPDSTLLLPLLALYLRLSFVAIIVIIMMLSAVIGACVYILSITLIYIFVISSLIT